MPPLQLIELAGQRFVVIGEDEYDHLRDLAASSANDDDVMPALPAPNKQGLYPAADYALASLARDFIRDRKQAGLTRASLAKLAGISVTTLARIESGQSKPSLKTVERIDSALSQVLQRNARKA